MTSAVAEADVTRVRIAIGELPRQDTPITIADAKSAVLPDGAREGSAVPKSWPETKANADQRESAHCTDSRRGSVNTIYASSTGTKRVWEANGKIWLDTAEIDTTWGSVHVTSAERVPLARVAEGIWAYRRKDDVVLVAAQDVGFVEHGAFYECRVQETIVDHRTGTALLDSSPQDVNDIRRQIAQWSTEFGKPPKWQPEWVGVEFRAMVSVSKSSADPAAMLNVVLRRP